MYTHTETIVKSVILEYLKLLYIQIYRDLQSEKIFDWIKKIICLKHFLWCKDIFYFSETKFVWFKQNIFGQINICSNQINFCLKSNKLYFWPYINALISLFWRKINLIQTNFISFKQIISLNQRKLFKKSSFFDSIKSFFWV